MSNNTGNTSNEVKTVRDAINNAMSNNMADQGWNGSTTALVYIKALDESLATIEKLLLEVIGEDDTNTRGVTQDPNNANYLTKKASARNALRATQRTTLKAVLYGEKN